MSATPATSPEDMVSPEDAGAAGGSARAPSWLLRDDRRMAIALAVALALHLMPLAIASGSLAFLGIGVPPSDEVAIGSPDGRPEGVHVETIDGAEFDRRFVSYAGGKDNASNEQPEQAASDPTPPTPQGAPPKAEADATPPLPPPPDATLPSEVAVPPPKPKAQAQPQNQAQNQPQNQAQPQNQTLTEADIAELVEMTRPDRPSVIQMIDSAAGARQGVMSEFTRSVVRKIKSILPEPRGAKGIIVIGFIITDSGEPTRITVLESSRNPAFDAIVVERVRAARFMVPGRNVRPDERVVRFSYEFG